MIKSSATQGQLEYWSTQAELIKKLHHIGFKFPLMARLDLFWLRASLIKFSKNEELRDVAIGLIDRLVFLRRHGHEPPHKNGKYL